MTLALKTSTRDPPRKQYTSRKGADVSKKRSRAPEKYLLQAYLLMQHETDEGEGRKGGRGEKERGARKRE